MGILGQKGRFWTIFGQKGAIFEFSVKKRKCHFFTNFFFIFPYKKSENSNAQIFKKMGTYERLDERTEVNPKVHRLRRETKNGQNTDLNNHIVLGTPKKPEKGQE